MSDTTKPDSIRSATLYVRPVLRRWLEWACQLEQMNNPGNALMPQEQMAEVLIREGIAAKYPGIEKLDEDYWSQRRKLSDDMAGKLVEYFKSGQAKAEEAP